MPCASKITLHVAKGDLHETFYLESLHLGDLDNVASHSEPGGLDGDVIVDVTNELGEVHVAGVDSIRRDDMDQGVKHKVLQSK